MKELVNNMLAEIEVNISEIDLYMGHRTKRILRIE